MGVLGWGAGRLPPEAPRPPLTGYLLSYFVLLAVKTGRWHRYRHQLPGYGGWFWPRRCRCCWRRPGLRDARRIRCRSANLWHARRRRRALANGMAPVLQSTLMVFLVAIVAGVTPLTVWDAFVAVLLYLAGTVLYVKTVIRERGSRRYLVASVAYHAVALGVAVLLAPVLALPFGWFLARAVLVPRRTPPVAVVGLLEIAGSVALVLAAG